MNLYHKCESIIEKKYLIVSKVSNHQTWTNTVPETYNQCSCQSKNWVSEKNKILLKIFSKRHWCRGKKLKYNHVKIRIKMLCGIKWYSNKLHFWILGIIPAKWNKSIESFNRNSPTSSVMQRSLQFILKIICRGDSKYNNGAITNNGDHLYSYYYFSFPIKHHLCDFYCWWLT